MNRFVCKSVFFVFVSFCSRKKKNFIVYVRKKKFFLGGKGFVCKSLHFLQTFQLFFEGLAFWGVFLNVFFCC